MYEISIIFTIFFVISNVRAFENQTIFQENPPIQPKIFEDKILLKVEELRTQLIANGNFDPLLLNINDFDLSNLGIDAKASVNGQISGILQFQIPSISFTLAGFRLNLVVNIPELKLQVDNYKIDSDIDLVSLYGNGKLDLSIENLAIDTNIKMTNRLTDNRIAFKLKIESLDVIPSINGKVQCKLTGWLNDEKRSKLISNLISNNLATVINQYQQLISNKLSPILFGLVKDYIIELEL